MRDDRKFLALSLALPVLPDADTLMHFWVPYEHLLGHRGFFHSLLFALLCGVAAAAVCRRLSDCCPGGGLGLAAYFFCVTASHGVFDALTTGGLGVGFFSPIHPGRFFFSWRAIPAAPLSPLGMLSSYGAKIMLVEGGLFGTFAAAAWIYTRQSLRGWQYWTLGLLVLGVGAWAVLLHPVP